MGDQATETGLRLLGLRADHFKRLQVVALEFGPNQSMVEVTGRNGEGKTSLLDAVWVGLAGGAAAPKKPIRDGEEKATIELDLGEYKITRTFTAKGSYLTVENAEGASFKSPQALLDKLYGDLTFDPTAFTRMKSTEQRAVGLRLCGLTDEITRMDAERAEAFGQRTDVNRKVEETSGGLAQYADLPEDPPEPIDTAALVEARAQRQATLDQRNETLREIDKLDRDADGWGITRGERLEAADEADAEIARLQERAVLLRSQAEECVTEEKRLRDEHAKLTQVVESLPAPTFEDIDEQLALAGQRASEIARFEARATLATAAAGHGAKAKTLTERIAEIDRQKRELVKAADLPIDGLGFSDDGVTLNGIPLEQASSAEQLRVGVAIAMALNPKLRLLRIADGSLLDDQSFAILSEMAGDKGYQVLVERVDWPREVDGETVYPVGVYIEDGSVAAVNGTPIPRALPETVAEEAGDE